MINACAEQLRDQSHQPALLDARGLQENLDNRRVLFRPWHTREFVVGDTV